LYRVDVAVEYNRSFIKPSERLFEEHVEWELTPFCWSQKGPSLLLKTLFKRPFGDFDKTSLIFGPLALSCQNGQSQKSRFSPLTYCTDECGRSNGPKSDFGAGYFQSSEKLAVF